MTVVAEDRSIEIVSGRGIVKVRIAGSIDERFAPELKKLAEVSGYVVIDMDGVKSITSFGVRAWMTALDAMRAPYFCFTRCRPAIVAQFNMVRNFARGGHLVSLYVPYVCPECGAETDVLVDVRRQRGELFRMGEKSTPCPKCGTPAEFDDTVENYFAHVISVPVPPVPPELEYELEGDVPTQAPLVSIPFRVEKEVTAQLTTLWFGGAIDAQVRIKRVVAGIEGRVLIVMREVHSLLPDGRDVFANLASLPGMRISLARVPSEVGFELVDMLDMLGDIVVVSVDAPLSCAHCGTRSIFEAKLADFAGIATSERSGRCSCCNAMLPLRPDLARLVELPWADADEEVARYLATRQHVLTSQVTLLRSVAQQGDETPPAEDSSRSLALPSSRPRLADDLAGDRYELLRPLGRGGMATVYLGRVRGAAGFERLVALKKIHPHLADDPECIAMFLDEARLAAKLHHPNIVATLDVEEGADGALIVMEYVDGLSVYDMLSKVWSANEKVPVPIALRIMIDALAGLHSAHELRDKDGSLVHLVHRDVSSSNLLVGLDGMTRVTDFGIALAKQRLVQTTGVGHVKGTPGYMAPEQGSRQPVDRRADIFAIGVVALELFYRPYEPPHTGFGAMPALALRDALIDSLKASEPELPRAILAVCLAATEPSPAARLPTAVAFVEALELGAVVDGVDAASTREVGLFVAQLRGVAQANA